MHRWIIPFISYSCFYDCFAFFLSRARVCVFACAALAVIVSFALYKQYTYANDKHNSHRNNKKKMNSTNWNIAVLSFFPPNYTHLLCLPSVHINSPSRYDLYSAANTFNILFVIVAVVVTVVVSPLSFYYNNAFFPLFFMREQLLFGYK